MIFLDGKKFACSACIRGHRASSCNHSSRELTEIRPKGRPVTQCERCRQLRKTRKAHVKCLCSEMDSASPTVETSTIQDLLNPCKCSSSDICVCCRPVISDYLNRNYTLEVVEEEVADTLVQIRAEPIVMSAPAVSMVVEANSGVTAACPSGPNASCCKVERSSNGALPSHKGSRDELNLPRFKVERRSNGIATPRANHTEQFQPGSAPQFREPNARRTERSGSVVHRTLDQFSDGRSRQSQYQYSGARSPGSPVAPSFSHDSGVQLSPNGMHYSDVAPGGDGRPNCKCGCDCGTFLDTLIRAIEDRVRGAVPLVDAESNGDAAAMNRFIREILSPLDNPL
ncbi:copper-binding transcription factor, partial [Coemansia sp. BCRC 34301]